MRQRKKYGWPVIGNLPITGAVIEKVSTEKEIQKFTFNQCYNRSLTYHRAADFVVLLSVVRGRYKRPLTSRDCIGL